LSALDLDLIGKAVLRHRSLYLALVCELAFGFLVTCTLLQTSRWYLQLTFSDTGYSLGNLLSITVEQPAHPLTSDWRQQVLAEVRHIPGVTSAATTEAALNELPRRAPVEVQTLEPRSLDETAASTARATGTYPIVLGQGAAEVYGFRFLRGGAWSDADAAAADRSDPREVIITESLADALFATAEPIDRLVQIPGEPRARVVGVIADATLVNPFLSYAKQAMFFQGDSGSERHVQLVARVVGRPMPEVAAEVMRTLQAGHPERFVYADSQLRGQMRADRVLRSIAHFLFLFVVLIGLAGLVSTSALEAFLVNQRTHQIGIKRALGAPRGVILRGVLLETLLVTSVGCAVGIGLTSLFFRGFGASFGGLRLGWVNAVLTAGLLFLNALVAAYFPARRAASVPPWVASQGVR
jgi:putative ABC transport system permease protein